MKWISFLVMIALLPAAPLVAQQNLSLYRHDFSLLEHRLDETRYQDTITDSGIGDAEQDTVKQEFPSPKSVLFKSLIIPGWGQVVNKQVWKVPIIYGLFAGVGYYTYYINGQYQDYRAAYYNTVHGPDSDQRFGPTPGYLEGVSGNQLQSTRNSLRNQRDFMFVVMGLAYGLNALDAYVFAHMRSFDVSDDLSAESTFEPVILMADAPVPGVRVSLTLTNNK